MNAPSTHLVLDIETLSTDVNAVVTQVGWVMIHVDGEGFAQVAPCEIKGKSVNVSYREQLKAGREISDVTLNWWLQQDRDVFAATVNQASAVPPERLYEDLAHLCRWEKFETVWAYGASFDFAILRSLWGNRTPWSYRQERCARTFSNMFNVRPPAGPSHLASEDAMQTAQLLIQLHNEFSNPFQIR